MPSEIKSLRSIIKSENINISPDSFGGDLDPMCTVCTVCAGCVLCTACAGCTV